MADKQLSKVRITLPIRTPERAVAMLLNRCEKRDLVKFASELNFALHRIGAINKYPEYLEEVLEKVRTA